MCDNQSKPGQDGEAEANKWKDFFKAIKKPCEDYAKPVEELAFNPFVLMSDTYHRENFHSDILKAILSPTGTHGEGTRFLNLFYDLLIEAAKAKGLTKSVDGQSSLLSCYPENIGEIWKSKGVVGLIEAVRNISSVAVTRETGRTDIAIYDIPTSKTEGSTTESIINDWVIIIENKINGAPDQPRQLPRYQEYWKGKGKTVLAFVYIVPSDSTAEPDTNQWPPEDKKSVFHKLITIPAYNENLSFSLFNFLRKCELEAKKFNSVALFRQYASLMKEQAGVNMDEVKKVQMTTFVAAAKGSGVDFTNLRTMLSALYQYYACKICDALEAERKNRKQNDTSFPQVNYRPNGGKPVVYVNFTVNDGREGKITLAIDVSCYDLLNLGVSLFGRNDVDIVKKYGYILQATLNKLGLVSGEKLGWEKRYVLQYLMNQSEGDLDFYYPGDNEFKKIADDVIDLMDTCQKVFRNKTESANESDGDSSEV